MNPSINEIFLGDARKYIGRLRDALDASATQPDAEAIRRSTRRLNHAATLAHQQAVADATAALQKMAVKAISGKLRWTGDLTNTFRTVLVAMEGVVDALPEGDADAEALLRGTLVSLGAEAGGISKPQPELVDAAETEVDEAESVLAALIEELADAVERLENDPRDREPLKLMLRRIRRLRELGKIEPVSAADKALTAVEELILQIADLNATVGPGYLTVFRHARQVMERLQAGEQEGDPTPVRRAGVAVDELKDKVMETARRARVVVWVSDLFYENGAPIVECPVAEQQAGSHERYFLTEATQRLDRSDALRNEMLESDAEKMRLAGESLAHTLRHLRERAVAFNHPGFGRVTRRAAAALRAQLVRPPARVRSMAAGLGSVFSSLREYLETTDLGARARVVEAAEASLHVAILGDAPEVQAQEEGFDPDRALQQALALRTSIDERLQQLSGPEVRGLRKDLEELFDLIAYYVSEHGGIH